MKTINPSPAGFVGKPTVALHLDASPRHVNNLMTRRVIPFYKVGGRVLFRLADVDAALERYRVNSSGEVRS